MVGQYIINGQNEPKHTVKETKVCAASSLHQNIPNTMVVNWLSKSSLCVHAFQCVILSPYLPPIYLLEVCCLSHESEVIYLHLPQLATVETNAHLLFGGEWSGRQTHLKSPGSLFTCNSYHF